MHETKPMAKRKIATTLLGISLLSIGATAQEGQATFQTYPPSAKVYLRGVGQGGRSYLGYTSRPLALPDLDYSKGYVEFEIEHPDGQHEIKVERVDRTIRDGKRWPKQGEIVLEPKSNLVRITDLIKYPTTLSYILALLGLTLTVIAYIFLKYRRRRYEIKVLESLGQCQLDKGKHHFDRLGDYYLLRPIGAGAMGEVRLGCHYKNLTESGLAAVKRIKPPDPPKSDSEDDLKRTQEQQQLVFDLFQREVRRSADINHDNVVKVIFCDPTPPNAYIVMERIKGDDLAKVMQSHPNGIPLVTALSMMKSLCAGLEAIHEKRIIHRDIKPANIMVSKQDGRVIIIDLGVARKIDNQLETSYQTTAVDGFYEAKGTLQYFPPELLKAVSEGAQTKTVDISKILNYQTDLYALGLVFFEMLSGIFPERPTTFATTRKNANLAALKPDLPDNVVAIVQKMIANNPDDRFPSVIEVKKALESL